MTVHIDDNVSAFGPVRILTLDNDVSDDDPAANARAKRPEHKAVGLAGSANPKLAVGGRIGVVLQECRLLEVLADRVTNRKIPPAGEIRRLEEPAARDIHRTGSGQPDGVNVG